MQLKLKKIVKKILVKTGFVTLMINITKYKSRILMYHSVSELSLSPATFEEQLKYIKKHFSCFWMSEISRVLKKQTLNKPALFLTFDDGLKNNFKNVVPLLEKYNIKATFYITCNAKNNLQMLWNHEMRCLLMMIKNRNLPKTVRNFDVESKKRWQEVRSFVEEVKGWDNTRRLKLLDDLQAAMPNPIYKNWMKEEFELMNKEDILGLPDIVEIGSHTCSHPNLCKLSEQEARYEIKESAARLNKLTGRKVVSFCYPDGKFSERDVSLVRDVYQSAASVREGFAGNELFILNRIPAARNYVDFIFRLIKPDS